MKIKYNLAAGHILVTSKIEACYKLGAYLDFVHRQPYVWQVDSRFRGNDSVQVFEIFRMSLFAHDVGKILFFRVPL